MRTYSNRTALQKALFEARQKGNRVAFVPTMGNLHRGHIRLVQKARELAETVVVSIFVNPMQFGPQEDLASYPRTLAADKEKLFAEGVQILYTPEEEEIYPQGPAAQTRVQVPGLEDILCGASRPGHFTGVATVVSKFFNIVRPDSAIFGEKDFQQLSIIRKMAADLCMPIEIVSVATVRDEDGLALSSRNCFLSASERKLAPRLNEVLMETREAIACGFDNFRELETHACLELVQAGFDLDYFQIRDAHTLRRVTAETEEVAILAAARLGKPRLIDNVRLALNPVSDWGVLSAY